jgi:hypothetical protein
MSESATTVEPKAIVIERRSAIIGGAVIAAVILILSVALAFSLGDNDGGFDGPRGVEFSQGGFAPGMPEGGPQQVPVPQSAAPMPLPPNGSAPPSGDYYYGQPLPAPPSSGQAPQSGGPGSGGGSTR